MRKCFLSLILCSLSNFSFGQFKASQAIDSIFTEWNKANVPGCALGIIKDGELIYSKGYGLANMEYNIPNSDSSAYWICSTSKQFTAACIVLLAEQGKLSFDDNLKSFFPDFPEYAKKITIRHLLNHTSGIRDYANIIYLKGLSIEGFFTDADIKRWLTNQTDLNFAPGEEFLYSNSGYWLLGQIVNKVSGTNLADFARKEIFEPLGMNNTYFYNDHTQIVKNRAFGYVPNSKGTYKISMISVDVIGAGGIYTTIKDIKKWDDAYYNSTVLSKTFWKEMTKQGVLNNGKVIDYASGLMIGEYKGLKTIRHDGGFVGLKTEFLRFPEEHLSIVIFANREDANATRKANQVADVLLDGKLIEKVDKEDKKPKTEAPIEEFKLNQLTGIYEIQPGMLVKISIKDDSLNVFEISNNASYNIFRTSGNTFKKPGKKDLSFVFSNLQEGHTQTVSAFQGDRESKAVRKDDVDVPGINLNDYTGSYYSKELDVIYKFEIENGNLKMRIEDNQSTMDCTIDGIDQFAMEWGLVRFQRTDGLISGFELDAGRVKNLKFEKK
jgi:CubicO group peptidase (beta-lactamase class C family)